MIKTANAINNAGVKNFPTLSTTLEGLTVKTNVMAKKITENTIGFASGISGKMDISNVVAPVLGMDISGPIQASMIHPIMVENFSPTLERTPIPFVWYLQETITARTERTTSPTKNPAKAIYHFSPDNTPK